MKFAYIEWVDSVHQDCWVAETEMTNVKGETSCGILVRETDTFITLCLSYAEETHEYGQVISIPKVAITKLVVFNQPKLRKPKVKDGI